MTLESTTENAENQEAPTEEVPATEETSTETAPVEGAEPAEAANADAEAAANSDEEEKAAEDKRKRAGGFQRRIEKLEREREILLAQLQTNRPPQPAQQQPEKPKDAAAEFEQFIANKVAERLAAEREQERHEKVRADFDRRTQEVRAANSDFDDALASVSHIPVPPFIHQALLTAEQGPALMYQLAKNPAELARISALPPVQAALEIGRLDAKVSVAAAPKTAPKPVARKPAAPAPITPVTTRGASNVKRPEDMTYDEYSAWRDSQRKR